MKKKVTIKPSKVRGSLPITTITYSKLVNLGGYQNERIEATMQVDADQEATKQFKKLKQWVEDMADAAAESVDWG